jgi:hypothetical protein
VHADWRTLESRPWSAGDWEWKLDYLLDLHAKQALDILAQTVGSHGPIRIGTRYAVKATAAFHGRRAAELLARWIRDDSLAVEDRLFAVDGLASIRDERAKQLLDELEPDNRLDSQLREAVTRALTPAPPPEATIRQWIHPGYLTYRSAILLAYYLEDHSEIP